MELLNATKMQAGYTMGMQPDGRELLVVVVKGTFAMPKGTEHASLADVQVPLVEADVFSGQPGLSAPIYESDYAPIKPRCDVVLLGSAYAPGGRLAERVRVSLRVGEMEKSASTWLETVFGTAAPLDIASINAGPGFCR